VDHLYYSDQILEKTFNATGEALVNGTIVIPEECAFFVTELLRTEFPTQAPTRSPTYTGVAFDFTYEVDYPIWEEGLEFFQR